MFEYVDSNKLSRSALLFSCRKRGADLELLSAQFPGEDARLIEPVILVQLSLLERMRASNRPYAEHQRRVEELIRIGFHNAKSWRKFGWFHLSAEYENTSDVRIRTRDAFYQALVADPTDWLCYRDLGEIYLINRDHEKAYICFHEASRLNPLDPEPLTRMALASIRLGRVREAQSLVSKALELADKSNEVDPMTFDSAGMVKLLIGEFAESEDLLRRALSFRPHYSYFLSHLRLLETEKADHAGRLKSGRKYTPLYIRQRGSLRYFDDNKVPPPHPSVLEWLNSGVRDLREKKPVPRFGIHLHEQPVSSTLHLIARIKYLWFTQQDYDRELTTLLAAHDIDQYWEAFIQLLYQLHLDNQVLRPHLEASRANPFGDDELLSLSMAFDLVHELELAVTVGLRAHRRANGEKPIIEEQVTAYLQNVELQRLLHQVPQILDDEKAIDALNTLKSSLEQENGNSMRRRIVERLGLLDPSVPGGIRRKIFTAVTAGVLTHLPTDMNAYRHRIDGAAFIREGICRFNRVVECHRLTFDRILHFAEPLSSAFAHIIGQLYNLPVELIDEGASSPSGLIAVYDPDLLDFSHLLYLGKRRKGQVVFAHALRTIYHSYTPDVVTHLYDGKSDERATNKALRSLTGRVLTESCHPNRFTDLLDLEKFLEITKSAVEHPEEGDRLPFFPEVAGLRTQPLVLPTYEGVSQARVAPGHDASEALIKEAVALISADRYDEALAVATVVREMKPKSIEGMQLMYVALQRVGDLKGASSVLEELLQVTPNDGELMERLSRLKYELGDFDDAVRFMLRAVQGNIEKLSLSAIEHLGVTYFQKGDFIRAEELFKRAADLDPQRADHYLSWSTALERRGKTHLAISVMQKAQEQAGPVLKVCEKLSYLYYVTGQYDAAIEYLTSIIPHHPIPQFFMERALNYAAKFNLERALEDLEVALEKDPTFTRAIYNKGKILERVGNYEKAIECYSECIAADYSTDAALHRRSVLFARRNEIESALSDIKRARALSGGKLYWVEHLRLEGKLAGMRQEERPQSERIMISVPFSEEDRETIKRRMEERGASFSDGSRVRIGDRDFLYEFFSPNDHTKELFCRSGPFKDEDITLLRNMRTLLSLWTTEQSIHGMVSLLRASRCLYDVNGLAFKLETAGRAWPRYNWNFMLEAPHLTPYHLYRFCIATVLSDEEFFTCGMHQMGFPDVKIIGSPSDPIVEQRAETFCLYHLTESPSVMDLDTMSLPLDEHGERHGSFRISYSVYEGYRADTPLFNPYGLYTLGDEQQIAVLRGHGEYLQEQTGMMRHPDPTIRLTAIERLGSALLRERVVANALLKCLDDPVEEIKVQTLSRLRSVESHMLSPFVSEIFTLMLGGTPRLRSLAFDVLYRLEGVHLETLASFLRSKDRFPTEITAFVRKIIEKADRDKLMKMTEEAIVQ